jgi:hypothetical protein
VFLFPLLDQVLYRIAFHFVVRELVDVARCESRQAQSAFGHELRVLPEFSRCRRDDRDRHAAFRDRHRLPLFGQREERTRVA